MTKRIGDSKKKKDNEVVDLQFVCPYMNCGKFQIIRANPYKGITCKYCLRLNTDCK